MHRKISCFHRCMNIDRFKVNGLLFAFQPTFRGAWWQSGNTLASHLRPGFDTRQGLMWEAGSCFPLVGSLQYRTLANSMYWFPLP